MIYIFLMVTAIFSFHSVVIPSDSSIGYLSTATSAISDTLQQPAFWLGAAAATATTSLISDQIIRKIVSQRAKELDRQLRDEKFPTTPEEYEILQRNYDILNKNYRDLQTDHDYLKANYERKVSDISDLSNKLRERPTPEDLNKAQDKWIEFSNKYNRAQKEAERRVSPSRLDSLREELAEAQRQLETRPTLEQLEAEAQRATTLEEELRALKATIITPTSASAASNSADQNGNGQATE